MHCPSKAYMQNIQTKSGKTADDFYLIATEKGFIVDGKIVAAHRPTFGMA
jgi:hypothetical protein